MTQQEFILSDRIQKIRQMYTDYDIENKGYIAFSGGKDSTVLTKLFDLAVPGNKIPRVYINTGIDYSLITDFVKKVAASDPRFIVIKPSLNITKSF